MGGLIARGVLLVSVVLSLVTPRTSADDVDAFGVTKLLPTAKDGREWNTDWRASRSVAPYKNDLGDPLLKNAAGTLSIKGGIATLPSARTRLFVLTPRDKSGTYTAAQWKNVEMTVYVRCGKPTQSVAGQAISLSARSGERHSEAVPCEGTSYHASLRTDGECGFKKEVWHTGGYSNLLPDPAPWLWPTVPQGRWVGMKFVCRNCDRDRHVRLQLYVDPDEKNHWKQVADVTDRGGWEGKEAGCNRPKDFIIAQERPAVYFRTDFVPVELKKFSVREVGPLP
jgi:hypothetical protein